MTPARINIGNRTIGDGYPTFVIAEAGANHNGDLVLAKEMVDAAHETGADCIKFQTFTAEEFCADRKKTFTYRSQGKVVTESEYEMFKRLEFLPEQWADLMAYCDAKGIMFLTTVQDPVNLDMMLRLGLKGIKVGSDDFDHVINLKTYTRSGLPLILSKGMADDEEVRRTIRTVRSAGDAGLAVLHCVSLYPCEPQYLNLNQISTLRTLYPDIVWGFSDHSSSVVAPALAVSLGAKIIEKHFTLDHQLPGPDHWFSMDVEEMSSMIKNVRFAEAAMGSPEIKPSDEEAKSRKIMRRRIVARTSLEAGAILGESQVMFKRAETGAYAGAWDAIAGGRLKVPKAENEGISEQDVERL